MTKIGRNDPCHCGSGKKFKKCCADKVNKPSPREVFKEANVNAKLLTQKWLGALSGGNSEPAENPLQLILDHFKVRDPQALVKVKSLGKVSEQLVHFYQGKQWIGEADLSVEGELILTTAERPYADELCKKLKNITGLVYLSRKEDKFEGLNEEARHEIGAGMLDFKKRFFKTWVNEPNDRLEGSTPQQAVEDKKLKPKLLSLITELEKRENKLPKKERFNFKAIRRELGLI